MLNRIVVFFTSFLFFACSTKVLQVEESKRIKEVSELFRRLEVRKDKIKSIFLESKADIFQKSKRVRGKLMINLKKPDKLRIDTISPFDAPISILLIKDNLLTFHDVDKKKTYKGIANQNNISKFIPVSLNTEQFIDMICGIAPIIKYDDKKIEYRTEDASYEIVLKNDDTKQVIRYDAKDLDIKKLTVYKNNKKRFYIEFSNFKKSNNIKYAKKIFFQDFLQDSKVKLKIKEIEFNIELENSSFEEKNNFNIIEI